MRVAILGSCVTRDAVPHFPKSTELVLYAARTSFLSLVAEPVQVDEKRIKAENEFASRIVYWDLTKAFWPELEKARPDIVVIDLIDERFDLWRKGSQIVVQSSYLEPIEKELVPGFDFMPRNDWMTLARWKDACVDGVAKLKQICPRIVVHRAMWAERYLLRGEARLYEDSKRLAAVEANAWLSQYYDHLLRICGNAKVINVPAELCVADPRHKWGEDYFHYVEGYYAKFGEMLAEVIR